MVGSEQEMERGCLAEPSIGRQRTFAERTAAATEGALVQLRPLNSEPIKRTPALQFKQLPGERPLAAACPLATACSQRVPCACRDRLAWSRPTTAAASWPSSSSASLSTGSTGVSAAAAARCLQLTAGCAAFARAFRLHRTASTVLQAYSEHRSRPSRSASVDFKRSRTFSTCSAVSAAVVAAPRDGADVCVCRRKPPWSRLPITPCTPAIARADGDMI